MVPDSSFAAGRRRRDLDGHIFTKGFQYITKMKNTKLFLLSVLLMLIGASVSLIAAPDPNFHIYLCFGQSNMEGQGNIETQDRSVDSRFQVLCSYDNCGSRRKGQWYDATPPLSCCSGQHLGPVDYFGRTLVKNLPEPIKVGVVVVAVAGCDIQLFEKNNYQNYRPDSYMQSTIQSYGGNPYGRLVDMGKEAQKVGVIKGILLHQGETNSGQSNWPSRVKAVYNDLLKDLGLNGSEVPLLVGEVVRSDQGGQCGGMNSIIANVPNTIPNSYVISAQGLGNKGDGLHFSSASYRTLGERYAQQMLKLLGDVTPTDTPSTPEKADLTFDGTYLKIETEEMPTVDGQYCKPYDGDFMGMAYYANNDLTSATVEFMKPGTYEFLLRGCADATTSASVTFSVGSESATYTWRSPDAEDVVKEFTIDKAGILKIQLLMETDQGKSDAFVDYVVIRAKGYGTGVGAVPSSGDIFAYPNPVDEVVSVAGGDVEFINVLDLLGVVRLKSSEPFLDMSELPAGSYFLNVMMKNGVFKNIPVSKK